VLESGAWDGSGTGLFYVDSTNIHNSGAIYTGTGGSGDFVADITACELYKSYGYEISGNYITSSTRLPSWGILLSQCYRGEIKNNTFSSCYQSIVLSVISNNITISGNTIGDYPALPHPSISGCIYTTAITKNIIIRDNYLSMTPPNAYQIAFNGINNDFIHISNNIGLFIYNYHINSTNVSLVPYSSCGNNPTTGTHLKGKVVTNITPTTGGYIGWVCTTSGTFGTLTVTGDMVLDSYDILCTGDISTILPGDFITITNAKAGPVNLATQVCRVVGQTITVWHKCTNAVTGTAVNFTTPTFKPYGVIA
jgi:parallel beta-helix repeat protein